MKTPKELLGRTEENGIYAIEMLTREITSYRAFATDSLTAKILSAKGYEIEDHGIQQVKGEGIRAERMYGIRVAKTSSL